MSEFRKPRPLPLEVVSVSRHALERYRIHYPTAQPNEVFLAVRTAIQIPREIALSLVGRRADLPARGREEHRLHTEGRGIFVVCELSGQEGMGFVRTYLRLVSAEQRRMARSFYLDPLETLRKAFEMGFEAARAEGAPTLAVEASEAHAEALSELAPRLASGGAPGISTVEADDLDPDPPTQEVESSPDPHLDRFEWAPGALEHLHWFRANQPGFQPDLSTWGWLTPKGFEAALSPVHVGPRGSADAALLEPSGAAVALIESSPAGRPRVLRIVNVARADRDGLLGMTGVAGGPRSGAEAVPRVEVRVGEAGTASAGEDETDLRCRGAHPGLGGGGLAPGTTFVAAESLRVVSWEPRALRQARDTGIHPIPPAWIHLVPAVEPDRVAALARELGVTLAPGAWAARRQGTEVLLLHAGPGDADASVASCGRLEREESVRK